jgi:hypothetical protein
LCPTHSPPADLGKPEWPGDDEKGPYFITVNGLQYAGLFVENQGTKTLYIRDEVREMWSFLDEPARTSMVQGPPGTGKSSSTLVWARNEAASGKSVLWVHLCQGYPAVVAHLEGTTVVPIGEMEITTVEMLVRSSTANIIVLDGVVSETRAALLEAVGAWVSRQDGRRVVRVTSESITVTGETLAQTRTKEHTVPSWTLEQYKTALTSDSFKEKVEANLGHGGSLDEKLANKFFLAGGCARWAFGFSYAGALVDIDKQLARSKDKQALSAGLQGHKAEGAVNHLIQRPRDGKSFLVSGYVARCLSEDCELSFVRLAATQAQGNPGFDGIVLEMDFMAQLRLARKVNKTLTVKIGDIAEEQWRVLALIHFTYPDDLQGTQLGFDERFETFENKFKLGDGFWLLPKLFNQGGYDAVQVELPDPDQPTHIHVRFVQVTRSDTHTLKLQYMVALLKALVSIGFEVKNVLVDFVVPADQCNSFNLGPTSGDLREITGLVWKSPAASEFCPDGHIRVAGLERTQ